MASYNQPTESIDVFNPSFFSEEVSTAKTGVPLNGIVLWTGTTADIPSGFIASSAANTIYIKRSSATLNPPVFDNAGASISVSPFSTFDNTTALSSNPLTATGVGTITYSLVSQAVNTLSFGQTFSVVIRATDDNASFTDATYYAVVSYPTYSAVNWLYEWASISEIDFLQRFSPCTWILFGTALSASEGTRSRT